MLQQTLALVLILYKPQKVNILLLVLFSFIQIKVFFHHLQDEPKMDSYSLHTLTT